jgi:two-component system, response regulator
VPTGNSFRVFYIDDDENDRLLLGRALTKAAGAEVRTFGSAIEAQEYLTSVAQSPADALPHLIVTDLKMPVMDGIQFVEWLRNSPHKFLTIVVLSGSRLVSDARRAYAAGANSFVGKASSVGDSERQLSLLVQYWRTVAVLPVPGLEGG